MAKELKYKQGDRCKILKDSVGHNFRIGTTVILDKPRKDGIPYLWWQAYPEDKTPEDWMAVSETEMVVIKVKTHTMANKHQEAALLKAAKELLVANNTVTTLELKLKLRKDAPEYHWTQATVSTLMADLAGKKKFTFVDQGTFRIYSALPVAPKRGRGRPRKIVTMTGQTQVAVAPAPVQAPVQPVKRGRGRPRKNPLPVSAPVSAASPAITLKPIAAKKPTRISHTRALELMENNKGHYFTAVFTKKDQTERTMNCKLMANQIPDRLGYIKVKEAVLLRQGKDAIRNVNLQTLKALQIGKKSYRVG